MASKHCYGSSMVIYTDPPDTYLESVVCNFCHQRVTVKHFAGIQFMAYHPKQGENDDDTATA